MQRQWDIVATTFPGGDIDRLLAEGWEPFAASPVGNARTNDGQQVIVQLVTLRKPRNPLEVRPGELPPLPFLRPVG